MFCWCESGISKYGLLVAPITREGHPSFWSVIDFNSTICRTWFSLGLPSFYLFARHMTHYNNTSILFRAGNSTLETFVKIQGVFCRRLVSCVWLNIPRTISGTGRGLLACEKMNYRYGLGLHHNVDKRCR